MMDINRVLKRIGRGEVAPAYYLFGEDDYLKREAVERIIEVLLPSELRAFNLEVVTAGEVKGETIISKAAILPFLAPRRVIMIKDADALDPSDHSHLASYLKNPYPTACLLFLAGKINQRTPFGEALQKMGLLFPFPRLTGREVRKWLLGKAGSYGRRLSPDVADLLVELVGSDLYALEGELEKLCLFVPEGEEINVESLALLVGESRMRSIFELVDAVGRQDGDTALKCLGRLLEEGEEAPRIIGMLARQIRLIWRTQIHMERNKSLPEMAQALGLYPGQLQALMAQSSSFPRKKVRAGLPRLLQADRDLKKGRLKPRFLLEFLVMDLCR